MAFRGKGMPTAIILVLVALGSVVFHLLSPWWWTPIASNWGYIDDTIIITFWITGVVFTAIVLFMAYCVFRFRHQPGRRAVYDPENKKLEWWLSIVTAVGVGAMLAPGLFVWSQFVTVPLGASEAEVIGQQWQWSFRLPGEDGRLGTSDTQYVSSDNPLGLNPSDPDAHDDVVIEASMCRSSEPRWIWCQAWSPTSGSPPPEPEPSSYSALSYAVRRTMPCVARSSLTRRANIRRGYENRRRSHNCRLALDKRRKRGRPGFEPRGGMGRQRRSA
jgi:hypothetical protein